MEKPEKQQSLDEEQLEAVTGGMDPLHMLLQAADVTKPLAERVPIMTIRESPEREVADAQQWVKGNPNKRRRTS